MREGWTETTLGNIAELISRGRAPSYCGEDGVVVLNQKCVRNGRIYFEFARLTDITKKAIPEWAYLRPGDTLINSTGVGTLGRASLVSQLYGPTTFDSHVTLVRPRTDSCMSSFVGLSLNFREKEIEMFAGGSTGQTELSREAVYSFPVTLPPIAEQKRIVDVVSSVDAYIDALQQHVDTARTARNAVLHELLTAGGDDWTETTLGHIAELISRGRAPSYCEEDGVVVLNQKCVRNGRIHFEFARHTNNTKKAVPEWAYLKVGDSLINSTGVGTLGRASFVSQINGPTTFDSHVTLVRPRPESCFASFIGLSLNFRENEIEMFAGGSTGQTELSREAVNSFPVTLPPIAEQKRIVEIVSSMDDVIQAAERAVVEAKNLRSGLLSDLLSGEHEIPVSYDALLEAA